MITTRFAPSPTGYLHLGGLRTALFNYLFAKGKVSGRDGRFLLRIEDTDKKRNSKAAASAIIEAFKWVGLEYDGEVVYQSQRDEIYAKYAKILLDSGAAYHCYTTKEELDALRERQIADKKTPRYDNRWRDCKDTPPAGIAPCLRLRLKEDEIISFHDGVKGEVSVSTADMDDFILVRSDGSPTYNFVVVIDDMLMGISHVIRGDDHLSNTPKQIAIYNALGATLPAFYHVPMILNEEGHKLSKRDGAQNVMEYKEGGFLPEAFLNFLLRLGFSDGDREFFTRAEMLELFTPEHLSKSPSSFNLKKLLFLNNHYIKECEHDRLEELLSSFGAYKVSAPTPTLAKERRDALYIELAKRSDTLVELKGLLDDIYAPSFDAEFRIALLEGIDIDALRSALSEVADELSSLGDGSLEDFKALFKTRVKETSKKYAIKPLMQILRYALLGKKGGISLDLLCYAIGGGEAKERIALFSTSL